MASFVLQARLQGGGLAGGGHPLTTTHQVCVTRERKMKGEGRGKMYQRDTRLTLPATQGYCRHLYHYPQQMEAGECGLAGAPGIIPKCLVVRGNVLHLLLLLLSFLPGCSNLTLPKFKLLYFSHTPTVNLQLISITAKQRVVPLYS